MSRFGRVLAVVALCLFGAFAAGCGDDGASQEQLDQAREEGAKQAREQAEIDQLEKEVTRLKQQTKKNSGKNDGNSRQGNEGRGDGYYETDAAGGPVSSCTGSVRVGPNTSCDFAMNVAGEYGSNPGASTINAFSPATGEHYTLSCGPWSGGGTVCTGGNGAAVYLP